MKSQILILAIIFFTELLCAQQPVPNSNSGKGTTPLTSHSSDLRSSSTYAVVIGISDYQDPGIPDLQFADKDAEAFANYLRSSAGGELDNDHLKVLINQQATMAQFGIALDWLMENAKENDRVVIYFSGHGDVEKKTITQPGFLLCWDAPARVYISGGAFALPMLQEVISTLSIQNKAKVIVVTDACRSGTLAGSSVGGSQATAANLAKQFGNEIKIMSCQPNEYSIEGEQWGGGRGAFSFHLIDALYGLADNNSDQIVTLQEAGRYLEDHVSNEVAPVSQVPMIVGNRNERLTSVDASLLASMKSGKTNQMAILTPITSKGIEEDVLKGVDTSIRKVYHLFKNSIKDKQLLEPVNACANIYYEQLIKEPKLERLYSTMKRNFAAALQDDAQQAINIWLKADVQQVECIGKLLKLEPIPSHLQHAAQLLGEQHYMYKSLLSRKMMFEGIIKQQKAGKNEKLARQCLELFNKSVELEPQSPLPWHQMSLVYAENLRKPDSAFICVRKTQNLAPNWVLPFVDLVFYLTEQGNLELAKQALIEAQSIDSVHPYVINRWAYWYGIHDDAAFKEKAIQLFEKYLHNGGPMYPCWYSSYSIVLTALGRHEEAYDMITKGIALDSMNFILWRNLGSIYLHSRQYTEAEEVLNKVLAINPTYADGLNDLGLLYLNTGRFTEAEEILKQAVHQDSMFLFAWINLASSYKNQGRLDEAEQAMEKAAGIDSTYTMVWNNLGWLYLNSGRYPKAEQSLRRALALDSTSPFTFRHLGMVYFRTNRSKEAMESFQKAIAFNPDFAPAMLGMAYLLATENGKTNEAIVYVEQAIQKGAKFEQLEQDKDLASLRSRPEWKVLMKKYFNK